MSARSCMSHHACALDPPKWALLMEQLVDNVLRRVRAGLADQPVMPTCGGVADMVPMC